MAPDAPTTRIQDMPLFRYCPQCGQPLPSPAQPPGQVSFQTCPACDTVHYQNAKPTAGALIVRAGCVLLGKRAREPFQGWWDVPGGFLEPWERPMEALVREVREETGLVVRPTELLTVTLDTYGAGGDYTLNFFHLAEILGTSEPRPGDDVTELAWFYAEALPDNVAFASQRQVLDLWRRRMRGEG